MCRHFVLICIIIGSAWLTASCSTSSVSVPIARPAVLPGVATPTPASPMPAQSPTASPSPTPVPTLAASTGSLALLNQTLQTVTASEAGYTGAITESGNCGGIATISPTSGNGPSFTMTATPVSLGSCSITLTDANQESVSVPITVTTFGLTLQSRTSR